MVAGHSVLCKLAGGKIIEQSLLVLAEHGFHQRDAAERLNIHLDALRYRLRRASDCARFDLDDTESRFRPELALHLLALHDKERP